jgi:hypothetical protein
VSCDLVECGSISRLSFPNMFFLLDLSVFRLYSCVIVVCLNLLVWDLWLASVALLGIHISLCVCFRIHPSVLVAFRSCRVVHLVICS